MVELFVVGLSHQTAPLEVRERLSIGADRLSWELERVRKVTAVREAMLISTCNRVELYATAENLYSAAEHARSYLAERAQGLFTEEMLYLKRGKEAIRHAFRVAASLDSMVVGEPQILGQFKEAFDAAEATGSIGVLLDRCITRAFSVAKKIRTETSIAAGSVNVSSIACDLARKIFGDLRGRRALLLGAGDMGEAAAKSLASTGAHLTIINRSSEKARSLAVSCGGEPKGYEQLASELVNADVVITSTSSSQHVITADLMNDVSRARRHRRLFLIDIAVPRDIDPKVSEMESVFLYDVDDLQQLAAENLAARKQAAEKAEAMVLSEVDLFEEWRQSLALTPTIVALRNQFQYVVQAELERTLPKLPELSHKQRNALHKMCEAMVNKLLHSPLTRLKDSGAHRDGARLVHATQELFELRGETGLTSSPETEVTSEESPALTTAKSGESS